MAAGLEVIGNLTIVADDESRLNVEFHGNLVVFELPDVRTALALRRRFPRLERLAWLERLRAEATRAGLELQVWVGGRQIGRFAAETRTGWVANRLGLGPIELRVRSVLAALARSPLKPSPTHHEDARVPRDGRAEPS